MTIMKTTAAVMMCLLLLSAFISGCEKEKAPEIKRAVPHEYRWGIYRLEIASHEVELIYGSADEIYTTAPRLNNRGDKIAFAQKTGGRDNSAKEIYTVDITGENLKRLTNNEFHDVYPVWSPDDTRIAFLTMRDGNLDIYMMNADGTNQSKFYDSGDHDADIDWEGDTIAFTSQSAIWVINDDGTGLFQVTDIEDSGKWGTANLPMGDYDPRLSPGGDTIVFERLENIDIPNGGYNFFTVSRDGSGETRLTDNYYAQGLADWSHSGEKLVYTVAAIDGMGKYDIYIMNRDGSDNHNITPDYFPDSFVCYGATFSKDDSSIYFTGEWWETE